MSHYLRNSSYRRNYNKIGRTLRTSPHIIMLQCDDGKYTISKIVAVNSALLLGKTDILDSNRVERFRLDGLKVKHIRYYEFFSVHNIYPPMEWSQLKEYYQGNYMYHLSDPEASIDDQILMSEAIIGLKVHQSTTIVFIDRTFDNIYYRSKNITRYEVKMYITLKKRKFHNINDIKTTLLEFKTKEKSLYNYLKTEIEDKVCVAF